MLELTQLESGAKIAVYPEVFILHQPRKVRLNLPGKMAFHETTLMCVYAPATVIQVREDYHAIAKELLSDSTDFVEFTHGQTGTRFIVSPRFFILADSGYQTLFYKEVDGMQVPQVTDSVTLISVMNPIASVPIKGSFSEAYKKYHTKLSTMLSTVNP